MNTKPDPPTKRKEPKTNPPSEEYKRFESLTKRLLRVPKKEINGADPAKTKKQRNPARSQ
jgi:hypothetical protein